MKTKEFQARLDKVIEKVFFRFIPQYLTPNHFTYIRIILVPIIYFLLTKDKIVLALVIFVIAGLTDLIDGSLARLRNQVTDLGKIIDPLADKMLVITPLIFFGSDLLIVWIIVIISLFEVVGNLGSALLAGFIGRPVGANFFGKIKFTLQAFAAGFLILGIIIDNNKVIQVASVLLYTAIFFALLSSLEQIKLRIDRYLIPKLRIKK